MHLMNIHLTTDASIYVLTRDVHFHAAVRVCVDLGGHPYWTLAEWCGLLESCKLFEDSSFRREEGNLCFYLAKFEVTKKLVHWTVVER